MKTINQIQDEIIHEFNVLEVWLDKYALLIEMGNELPALDLQYRTINNLIEGCQSRVWLHADLRDGRIVYQGDSDALIVKGIIFLVSKILSFHTPDEILSSSFYFIDAIGLKDHLSPTRSNGLLAILKQMKLYALAFKSAQ